MADLVGRAATPEARLAAVPPTPLGGEPPERARAERVPARMRRDTPADAAAGDPAEPARLVVRGRNAYNARICAMIHESFGGMNCMRPSLLIPAVYAVTAVVCSFILSFAIGTGIEQIGRSFRDIPVSKASDSGRFVMHRETNDGFVVLDTQTAYPSGEGRGCVRLSGDCDVLVGFVPVPGQQLVQAGCGMVVDPA